MKTITALKQQKNNPQRVNIYLDGEFAFGLSKFVANWLKIGQELSDQNMIELQSQDEFEKAYQKALYIISYRPRSTKEVKERLYRLEIPRILVQGILDKLHEKQFLNDRTFAIEWVENRCAFKPRSRYLLRRELFLKGISEDIIDQSLESVDDLEMAYKAANKKIHRFIHLDQEIFRKKLLAFLSYRGFQYSISAEVCQKLWASTQKEYDTTTLNKERIKTWKITPLC